MAKSGRFSLWRAASCACQAMLVSTVVFSKHVLSQDNETITLISAGARCEGNEFRVDFLPSQPNRTNLDKLSVDWGEYSSWYEFESLYRFMEQNCTSNASNYVFTSDLPLWDPNDNATTSGYITEENGTVTFIHRYRQPGIYLPLMRHGVFVNSYSEFRAGFFPCAPYDDFTEDCGQRDDSACDGEQVYVIVDTTGNCSLVLMNATDANITDKLPNPGGCIVSAPPVIHNKCASDIPPGPSASPTVVSLADVAFPVGPSFLVLTGLIAAFQLLG